MTPFTKSGDSMEHGHAAELRREHRPESSQSLQYQAEGPIPELHAESSQSLQYPSPAGGTTESGSSDETPRPSSPARQYTASSTPFLNTAMGDGANNASNRSGSGSGRKFVAHSSSSDDSMPGHTNENCPRHEPHPSHRAPYPYQPPNVRPDFNLRQPCCSEGYDLDKPENPWVAAKLRMDREMKERQKKHRELHHQRKQQQQQQQKLHHNSSIDNLPTLPFHSHQELSLAERCLRKLVSNSQFFPARAGNEDWFTRPSHDGEWGEYVSVRPQSSSSLKGSGEHGVTAEEATTTVTTLYEHEVRVEEMLGRGGFCEVRLAYLQDEGSSSSAEEQDHEKPSSQQPCYAIKYLSPTIAKRKSKRAFSRGAADLAIEARFLSLLSHDNIIRLHYVSAGTLRENYNCLDTEEDGGCADASCCDCVECGQNMDLTLRHLGYFLMLDRLHETLDKRIKHHFVPEVESLTGELPTKHHERHRCCTAEGYMHPSSGCHQKRWLTTLPQWLHHQAAFIASKDSSGPKPLKDHLVKRLRILRSVAAAMEYLHEHHIIFRDIKPDNIGFYFDTSGDERREVPKLFDFGLVKELKPSARVASISCHGHHGEDAVYKLTGRTGSRRYMSPEVAFSRPYNRKVDIYSFGILLYELSTLMQPFNGYTIHRHEVEVLQRGFRPCIQGYDYWPRDLACLIEDCWAGDMRDRPNIAVVMRRLDGCIEELTVPPKQEDSSHKLTAKSILASISQLHLSSSHLRVEESPVSPSTVSKTDDREPRGKGKMKQFLAVVPSPPFARSPPRKNERTAPQA